MFGFNFKLCSLFGCGCSKEDSQGASSLQGLLDETIEDIVYNIGHIESSGHWFSDDASKPLQDNIESFIKTKGYVLIYVNGSGHAINKVDELTPINALLTQMLNELAGPSISLKSKEEFLKSNGFKEIKIDGQLLFHRSGSNDFQALDGNDYYIRNLLNSLLRDKIKAVLAQPVSTDITLSDHPFSPAVLTL